MESHVSAQHAATAQHGCRTLAIARHRTAHGVKVRLRLRRAFRVTFRMYFVSQMHALGFIPGCLVMLTARYSRRRRAATVPHRGSS